MRFRSLGPLLPLFAFSLYAQTTVWKEEGIVHTAKSPYAKLHDVPIRAVTISDGFWGARRKTNVESSIPTMHDLMIRDGRMENFRRLSGKSAAPQKGRAIADCSMQVWMAVRNR
jgi:hypothetical protein